MCRQFLHLRIAVLLSLCLAGCEEPPAGEQRPATRGEVDAVAFSANDRTLVSVDRFIRRWDVASGKQLGAKARAPIAARSWVFNPDGNILALGTEPVTLWDSASGQKVATLPDDLGEHSVMTFSRDGRHLAVAGEEGGVRVWDVPSARLLTSFQAMEAPPGKTCKLPPASKRKAPYSPQCMISDLVFSPDGRLLATADQGRRVKIWNAATGSLTDTLPGAAPIGTRLAFSPDSRRLARTIDQLVHVQDLKTGALLNSIQVHNKPITALSFSTTGLLASGSIDGYAAIWHGPDRPILTPRAPDWITTLAFSHDGRRLAIGCHDGSLQVVDTATGKPVARMSSR